LIEDTEIIFSTSYDNLPEINNAITDLKAYIIQSDGVFNKNEFEAILNKVPLPPSPTQQSTKIDILQSAKNGNFNDIIASVESYGNTDLNKITTEDRGYGILDLAIISNNLNYFRDLIKSGFRPVCTNIWSDLYSKYGTKAKAIILELLSNNVDLSITSEYMSRTILGERDFDMLNILLGMDNNHIPMNTLKHILTVSLENNKSDTVMTLLELGLLPSVSDMSLCIKNGYIDLLKMLIIEIGYPVKNHPELLADATTSVVGEDMIDLLLNNGINPNNVRDEDNTAVLSATKLGRPEYFSKIIDIFPTLIDRADETGKTPLMLSITRNYPKMIKAVILAGANPNSINLAGQTPLFFAARDSTAEVIALLLDSGADIDFKNEKGTTAIMSLCLTKNLDGVKNLIIAGADPLLVNNNGMSALAASILQKSDVPSIVRALLEAGANPKEILTIENKEISISELANKKEKFQSLRIIADYL
jgi:ankyrin repeat protein